MAKQVRLSCGCYRAFEPTPMNGDYLWCITHHRGVHVKDGGTNQTGPGEYKNKCRHCRYSRRFGQSKLSAECKAAKHRSKNPSHTVVITAPDGSVHREFAPTGQQDLFSEPDEPPF